MKSKIGEQNEFRILTIEMDDLMSRTSTTEAFSRASETLITALGTTGLAYLHFGKETRDQYEEVVETAFAQSRRFFSWPLAEKKSAMPKDGLPIGVTRGYLPTTSEAGGAVPELKEAFSWSCDRVTAKKIHDNPFQYHNIWPSPSAKSEDMKQSFQRLFDFFYDVMCLLTKAIQPAFDSSGSLTDYCADGRSISLARSFHYLSSTTSKGEARLVEGTGSAPHTDWGFATLVAQQENSCALEVWDDTTKSWIPVMGRKRTLVLNGSDFLTLLSKALYKSPKHRVILTPNERFSFVYFQYPGYHTSIPPLDDVDPHILSHISLLKDQRLAKDQNTKGSLSTGSGSGCSPLRGGTDATFGALMANKWADVSRPVINSGMQRKR